MELTTTIPGFKSVRCCGTCDKFHVDECEKHTIFGTTIDVKPWNVCNDWVLDEHVEVYPPILQIPLPPKKDKPKKKESK